MAKAKAPKKSTKSKQADNRPKVPACLTDPKHGGIGWNIPARGGYGGGCFAGTAAAYAYLEFVRERHKAGLPYAGGLLQVIVLEMIGDKLSSAKKGQLVGFLSMLCEQFGSMANLYSPLDRLSYEVIEEKIQKALQYSDEEMARRARSVIAKQAWEKRRGLKGPSKIKNPYEVAFNEMHVEIPPAGASLADHPARLAQGRLTT